MAPRRGEIIEERKEGEPSEVVERISALEEKFSTMEGRLGSIKKMLKQLVEAQSRVHLVLDKGKDPIPNPNSAITHDEEELIIGGAVHPPISTGDPLGQPPRLEEQVAPAKEDRTDGTDGRIRRGLNSAMMGLTIMDRPWGDPPTTWVEGREVWKVFTTTLGRREVKSAGEDRRVVIGEWPIGPTTTAAWTDGDNIVYGRGENFQGGGISSHPMEEKGRGHQERLSTINYGEKQQRRPLGKDMRTFRHNFRISTLRTRLDFWEAVLLRREQQPPPMGPAGP